MYRYFLGFVLGSERFYGPEVEQTQPLSRPRVVDFDELNAYERLHLTPYVKFTGCRYILSPVGLFVGLSRGSFI